MIDVIDVRPRLWDTMTLGDIAEAQEAWVRSVGWGKESPLESLAMIASEVGEAVNECRGEEPTDKLGAELADIVLRTAAFAQRLGIDLQGECLAKMEVNFNRGTRGRKV